MAYLKLISKEYFEKIIMIDWKDISEILCPREIELCAFGFIVKDMCMLLLCSLRS